MRFIIGIDLGTTNSAVAFVDTTKAHLPVELFSIPQLVAEGHIESRATLPSFCYLAESGTNIVGLWAKTEGARAPTRLIQSAKSWLCNAAADRKDKILPVEAANLSRRMSPVEASALYLSHLKEAWNRIYAKGDPSLLFEEQEIVLTVPASFDEVARTLTVEAVRMAGLSHVTLLEEPQAAFYSWISQHEKEWQTHFQAGQSILICDVGGGTTDFSLIEIHAKDGIMQGGEFFRNSLERGKTGSKRSGPNEELMAKAMGDEEDRSGEVAAKRISKKLTALQYELTFQRMAVGDHLLLGGDNMDNALAYYLEAALQTKLEGSQWLQLLAEARTAKEKLLGSESKSDTYAFTLQGKGSSVVAGSLSASITKEQVEKVLGEGFFGLHPLPEALQLKRSRGLRSMGLPYEDEPSITKHLAHFLQQARYFELGKQIDFVLFNGGALKPLLFQQALLQSLQNWYPHQQLQVLPTASLDLAVARGAAYYGKVRRGLGVAIQGGLPRAYYLELEVKPDGISERKALTILPRGAEEGYEFRPELIFTLRSNTPVAFHLLTSHVRLQDQAGQLVEIEESEMQRLPAIQTILRFGRGQIGSESQMIPVRIGVHLTAVGTLELWVESQKTEHRWNLEFQWRAASGQDHNLMTSTQEKRDETFAAGYLDEAKAAIVAYYAGKIKPSKLMEQLEDLLQQKRQEWSLSVLRELWKPLIENASQRKASMELEARFWHLAGFFLRPGYGFPLDDFRVKELWKIILAEMKNPTHSDIQIAQWICFRRIAGGLNKGQQLQIASELTQQLFDKKSGQIEGKRRSERYSYSERIRALASLERVDLPLKVKWGEALLAKIKQDGEACDYWALARLGTRHLVYASVGQVVPRETCSKWVETLLSLTSAPREELLFTLAQLARKTTQRELNLPDKLLEKLVTHYPELEGCLQAEHRLSSFEQEQLLGDQLPPGLILEACKTTP